MSGQQPSEYAEILLSCIEEEYFEDQIALEYHAFARVISGEMKVVQNNKISVFRPGDTMLFPGNQLSTLIKTPLDGLPYRAIVISLKPKRLKEFYTKNPFELTGQPAHKITTYKKHPLLESFFASLIPYFDLESELPEKIISVKIEEALSILRIVDEDIDNLLANFPRSTETQLVDFMEKNYMFNMSIQKFGYLTGRSLTTFKRDFKKEFNTTPQRWITQKRLELAHYQLLENKQKPVDVYLETGFENLSHFSFAFKKHFGYAPTDMNKLSGIR